jgi:hypothetical protein
MEKSHGSLPSLADLRLLAPDLAAAAQSCYDAWNQDIDGVDDDVEVGGICDLVAAAMAERISVAFGDASPVCTVWSDMTGHTSLVTAVSEGVVGIDIPNAIYESGSYYVWKKRPGVEFTGDDVTFSVIDRDPGQLWLYADDVAQPEPPASPGL